MRNNPYLIMKKTISEYPASETIEIGYNIVKEKINWQRNQYQPGAEIKYTVQPDLHNKFFFEDGQYCTI